MSDKIDEIVDRLLKGGRGSGVRGHKSGPASDINREMDPDKKKKTIASDKKVARKEVKGSSPDELNSKINSHKEMSENKFLSPASRKSYAEKHKALVHERKKRVKAQHAIDSKDHMDEYRKQNPVEAAQLPGPFGKINKGGPGSGKKGHMGVTPDKSTRERNRQKAGEAIQTSRDAKRIIAELGLGKEDLKELRDYASAEGITPSQFIVNNKDHIKTNLKKGGPGSGKKGHKTNKQELKSKADTAHKRGDTEEYEKLISQVRATDPYKGNPAAEGNKASREDASGTRDEAHDMMSEMKAPGVGKMAKSDLDKSLDTLFYMNQLANQGRIDPSTRRKTRKMRKSISEHILEKKQGVPEGVDPAKHERCVLDVKAQGKDKSSAYAICNSSMNKGGPGSGKKSSGKIEPKHFEPNPNLRDKNKDLDRISPEESKKRKENLKRILDERRAKIKKADAELPPRAIASEESAGPSDDWWTESVTDRGVQSPAPGIEKSKKKNEIKKLGPLAVPGAKAVGRIVQNAIKPTDAGKGSDKVPGGPGGPSAAAGGGTGSGTGPSAPKISKSLAERLNEMHKGGPGSGRKKHDVIGQDYSDVEHESVFGDDYESTQDRLIDKDIIREAADREEKKAEQRIKEKESQVPRGISRKGPKTPGKKSFLQRMGQKIIDAI